MTRYHVDEIGYVVERLAMQMSPSC